MTAKNEMRPTQVELDILQLLWKQGPSTVRAVHDVLSQGKELTYTSTLKTMQVMHEKGLVVRDESQRSHIYEAAVQQKSTQRQFVSDLVDRVFGGATEQLVVQALSSRRVSKDEIAEIRKLLDELEGKGSGTPRK
ncbi:MAG: BlaI/MecI/CopY family transcriptional regulator [Planctomycetaceae bacterium]|nr:BlaI/MecI/CopY family transcriptional regulator [Planctomycetaceae bacterium]